MALKESLLAEFDHEIGTTRRLLDRVPDDRLDWKPHDKSMSLGRLATHLSNIPHWSARILAEPSFDLATVEPDGDIRRPRADILKHFEGGSAAARAMIVSAGDAELSAPWSLTRAGQQVFTMPRIAVFRSFVINHLVHHRGQLSVYLRLNDVPVPAIYGPSADEGN